MKNRGTSHQPLVSVIIPNYNHARFLDQRLQSVLNQTYRNIEVIILDDCSTDNSLEVIEKYRSDARIVDVIVNEKNSGNTFLQWDKGIHLAKGELVWIAESDDYCELNMLEELVKAYYHRKGTVLAYSTLTFVDEEGNICSCKQTFPNKYCSSKHYLKRYLALENTIENASCAIFSRAASLNVNGDYMSLQGAGDYLFWVHIVAQGRIAIVNKNLSFFRRHSNVVTNRRDADGTNLTEDWQIYRTIKEMVRIHYFRNRLACAQHAYKIGWVQFSTEQVRNEVCSLWNAQKYSTLFDRFLLRLSHSLKARFNIHI